MALALLLLAAVVTSYGPSLAVAQCGTYQTNLIVDLVNSNPQTVEVGGTVVTTVHVTYPDGTPATLSPETMSFIWHGSGQKIVENVGVVPTGEPGFYTYTQTITADFPTGTVTIAVVMCSCSDANGNFGPTDDVSSVETLDASDNSVVQVGPGPTPPPTAQELLATYTVPIVIVILLLIALLLFRARRKKR